MKLIFRILIRISLALSLVLAVWAFLFYTAVADEIDDETDDSLENYSEAVIRRMLAGEELPPQNSSIGHRYTLEEVSGEYAREHEKSRYYDSDVYFPDRDGKEPARVLSTVFRDEEGRYYELTAAVPSIEKEDLQEAVLFWIILLYATLLGVIVAVNTWVFHRSMKPLYVLLDWLDRYRIGGSNAPLANDTAVGEFRKLNQAALRNAARSEELFAQQKEFIGNASHEIQTPLAVCRNRLETLLEDETLGEEQLKTIFDTLGTLDHITKLNRSLLLLSKIDNGQFVETAEINMNELLERYLHDYEEAYAYRQISVEIRDEGTCRAVMNETLAAVLLTNLLKNAFVHNTDGGHITIETAPSRMIFRNSGPDEPLDGKKIFTRFYQGAKKEGSTGLGLAIAHAVCRLADIRLHYSYVGGEHCFEIIFPD